MVTFSVGRKQKLQLLFKPFLFINIGFLLAYTFMNWLLVIKTEVVSLPESLINYFLPCGLVWIPILVWLRSRVHLIVTGSDPDRIRFANYVMIAFAISSPTIIAQYYLTSATGELTQLTSTHQIDQLPNTKFYTVQQYYLDTQHPGIYTALQNIDKYGNQVHFCMYITVPIFDDSNDVSGIDLRDGILYRNTFSGVHAYYGIKFYSKTLNSMNEQEEEIQYRRFYKESLEKYKLTVHSPFQYLDRIGNNEDRDGFFGATQSIIGRPSLSKIPIILVPVHEPFENRKGSKFIWIIISFLIGSSAWFFMVFFCRLDEKAVRKYLKLHSHSDTNITDKPIA